ncbi:MAG TPA: extracellular solute-binding protein [Chloroflexota bacterium]|nr:extracellular solute-binding protein [Chloroflexota bacterium]
MTRRRLVHSALPAAVVPTLAACAPGQSAPAALVQAPAELNWTFWEGAAQMPFIDATAAEVERAHPKLKVVKTSVPVASYDQTVLTMVTGGTPPDVMGTLRFTSTSWAVKGITQALDQYLSRGGFKEGDYFPSAITPWRLNGKLYALPREVDLHTLWFNRQLFDQAGIKAPDETWTWETLVAAGQRLTRREGGAPQFAFNVATNHKAWVAFAQQNGTKLWDREVLPTKLLINTQPVYDAIQQIADLRNRHRVMPTAQETTDAGGNIWPRGLLAMNFAEASQAASYATTIKDFQYDVAVPPKGKQMGTWLGGACYSIPKGSTKREAAAQFILHASGVEGQKLIAQHSFGAPAIKSVADSDLFLKSATPQNKRAWRQSFEWGAGPPMTPNWPEIEAALNTELNQTWNGTRTAKASIEAAWPKVESLMQQAQDLVKQMPQ